MTTRVTLPLKNYEVLRSNRQQSLKPPLVLQSFKDQEFHEWQVFNDVVALVATQGLQSVMKTILNMMDERGIK
jgi:hypothetical protein